MNRSHLSISTIATMMLATLCLGANRAELNQAISILDDPKTTPQKKLAIIEKIDASYAYMEEDQRPSVLAAVSRQTRDDDKTVARAAWKLLTDRVLNPAKLTASEYQNPGHWNPAMNYFLSSGFDQMSGDVVLALQGDNAQARFAVLKAFAVSYASTRKTRDQFSEQSDRALACYLEYLDRSEPAMRPFILMVLDRMHPEDIAVPVYLRALAGDDALAQQLARGTIDRKDQWIGELDIQKAIALALASPDPKLSKSASELLNKVQTEELKGAIADIIASAAARGDLKPLELLEKYRIESERFARAIDEQLALTKDPASLLKAVEMAKVGELVVEIPSSRTRIAELLTNQDTNLALGAARLLTTPNARAAGEKHILTSISQGNAISPQVIKALDPDPIVFGKQLLDPLQSPQPKVIVAAASAIAVIGVKNQLVADRLNRLLYDRDLSIRAAAAEAINTPAARARVLVPQLLGELKSPSLATRQRAARQLDELRLEPKPVTTVLITATESRNFAVRQGILDALCVADLSGENALQVLKQTAEDKNADAKSRAYARASLRAVQQLEGERHP